jgi:hypothetical protein
MKRMRIFLLKLSLIIFSVLLTDGGKTYIVVGTGVHFLTVFDHNRDLESPDNHQFGTLTDFDKWVVKEDNLSITDRVKTSIAIYDLNLKSQDFINSIWQPPRYL